MYRYLFTVLLVTSVLTGSAQKSLALSVSQIVDSIARGPGLQSKGVGFAGVPSKQYGFFSQLLKTANEKQLIALTRHSSASVRCYAFWALIDNDSTDLIPIIAEHISDDEEIWTQFGCVISSELVGDFFIRMYIPKTKATQERFSEQERHFIDSLLVFTDNKLESRNDALARLPLTERLYDRVKLLLTKDQNIHALRVLAKFKRPEDKDLILRDWSVQSRQSYQENYRAIQNFPSSVFFPFLRKSLEQTQASIKEKNEWVDLYLAIAAYKTDEAALLLNFPFAELKQFSARPYHILFLFNAVATHLSDSYEKLYWKLWEEENKINAEIFTFLFRKDSTRAYELSKQTISKATKFLNTDYRNQLYGIEENAFKPALLNEIMDTVFVRDPIFVINKISGQITSSDVFSFPFILRKAYQINLSTFTVPLLQRLEQEDNPHVYLPLIKALLGQKDPGINSRIFKCIETNKHLREGWGGEDLRKILKEAGVEI